MKTAFVPAWHAGELIRWAGRSAAIIIMTMWFIFVIAEGVPNVVKHPSVAIWQLVALLTMFAGYAAGWRHERLGGVLALVGFAAFYVVNIVGIGVGPLPAFALMAVPGVLYLVAWRMARRDGVNQGFGHSV